MEYLSGGDLFQLITSRAPLDVATTRFIAAEIYCGLRFLHTRHIIQKDIKPEDILLDAAGHVKIADIGLAVMNAYDKISEYVRTPGYMAPEILSKEPYDTMVDLFSYGVILFQMATGRFPFYAVNDSIKRECSVMYETPPFPSSLHPELRDILEKTPDAMEDSLPLDELLSPPDAALSAEEQRLFLGFSFTSDRWQTWQRR